MTTTNNAPLAGELRHGALTVPAFDISAVAEIEHDARALNMLVPCVLVVCDQHSGSAVLLGGEQATVLGAVLSVLASDADTRELVRQQVVEAWVRFASARQMVGTVVESLPMPDALTDPERFMAAMADLSGAHLVASQASLGFMRARRAAASAKLAAPPSGEVS